MSGLKDYRIGDTITIEILTADESEAMTVLSTYCAYWGDGRLVNCQYIGDPKKRNPVIGRITNIHKFVENGFEVIAVDFRIEGVTVTYNGR